MNKAEEAQNALNELHEELQNELDDALAERESANERVKAARDAIAKAPRLHVKRTKKPKAEPEPEPAPVAAEMVCP